MKLAKKIGLTDTPLPKRLIEPKKTKSGRNILPPKRYRESQPTEVKTKSLRKDNQVASSIEKNSKEDKAPISNEQSLDQSHTVSSPTLKLTTEAPISNEQSLDQFHTASPPTPELATEGKTIKPSL